MKKLLLSLIVVMVLCVTTPLLASTIEEDVIIAFEQDTTEIILPQPELNFFIGDLIEKNTPPVPIPSTVLLLGSAVLAMIGLRRKKQ